MGSSSFTMKVDGVAWSASLTNLFAEESSHPDVGDYYHIAIGGQYVGDGENSEVSGINLYVVIPKDKFRNPKGTYPLVEKSDGRLNVATAAFMVGGVNNWYASYNPANRTETVGSIEITDFKIGQQHVLGQPTGVEGYTRLVGTFQMDLYGIAHEPAPRMKITEGKFDLTSGLGIEF